MKKYLIILISISLSGCKYLGSEKTGLEGKELPAFDLLIQDSTIYSVRNDMTPRAIVLILFSPYCPYCRTQIKEITNNMDKLKNIHFLLATRFSLKYLKGFYNEFGLNKFANITVGVDVEDFVTNYFHPTGIPFIAIYGTKKKLNNAFMGTLDIEKIKLISEQ